MLTISQLLRSSTEVITRLRTRNFFTASFRVCFCFKGVSLMSVCQLYHFLNLFP